MAAADDREVLKDALAVVSQQIRGLRDLTNVSLSGELLSIIRGALGAREHRRTLINAVLASIDARAALEADGYPALDPINIAPNLRAELVDELSDVGAAAGIFGESDMARQLFVNLGTPTSKV